MINLYERAKIDKVCETIYLAKYDLDTLVLVIDDKRLNSVNSMLEDSMLLLREVQRVIR